MAAIEEFGLSEQISFISTGGGATLELWEGKELPVLPCCKIKRSSKGVEYFHMGLIIAANWKMHKTASEQRPSAGS